jgi:hypothetical protein
MSKEIKLYCVKRFSTDEVLLVAGTSQFAALEVLASTYPDEDACDFEFMADSAIEVLAEEFGGICVMRDTIE